MLNAQNVVKKVISTLFPGYRVALRNEKSLKSLSLKTDSLDSELTHRMLNNLLAKTDYLQRSNESLLKQMVLLYWWDHTPPGGSLSKVKKDFFLNIPQAEGDLRVVQRILANMLIQFKQLCEDNEIHNWWIQAGTLLGAIRHNGFVPWDDDVDVGILRSDLERLRKALEKHPIFTVKTYCHSSVLHGTFAKFVYRDPQIPFFIDLALYDTMRCDTVEDAWTIVQSRRSEYEKEFLKLLPQLKRLYDYEPIDDPDDLNRIAALSEKYRWNSDEQTDNIIFWSIDSVEPWWRRCFNRDMFFPLRTVQFEGENYPAPRQSEAYLSLQYEDIWMLPANTGKSLHWSDFDFDKGLTSVASILPERVKKHDIIGYTAGAFDLFHIGHLNLLCQARSACSYLIVGVTTDELIEKTKHHKPAIPFNERVEILKSCKYVDLVVAQDDLDKVKAWEKYHFDILFSGDDWKDSPRWIGYEKKLKEHGAVIQYFKYTKATSSTAISKLLQDWEGV